MWDRAQQALMESMTRLLSQVASLLPGIVALIVALLISVHWLPGYLAVVLRRSLIGIRFDDRANSWGFKSLAEWSPSKSPDVAGNASRLLLIILFGFLIGIASFDATLTSQLAHRAPAYLPNVIGAVVVLLAGTIIARFIARSVLIGAVNMNSAVCPAFIGWGEMAR